MRYSLGVVVVLEAFDVTNNGRHFGFYQELEIWFKTREMVFFVLYMKNNKQISTLYDLSHRKRERPREQALRSQMN